jgi:hypothetical protein
MKTNLFLAMTCLVAGLTCHSLSAEEFSDDGETGAYGYTTIYYDPTTLQITAYSETELYGESTYYYDAQVNLSSNGHNTTQTAPLPGTTYVTASFAYQGAAGTTYTAYGIHSAVLNGKYFGLVDNDYFGLEDWAPYDILDLFNYPFTSFLPETDPEGEEPIIVGETYDSAEATTPANCGDIRTTIIQEYVTYQTPYDPQCSEFTQTLTDPIFTFAQLNTGTYTWAIIRSYFLTNLHSVAGAAETDALTFTINSAYRNPAKESAVSTAQPGGVYHAGSRHQYGDAVDLATTSKTWASFQQIGHEFAACVEPLVIQGNSTAHAHLDWRTKATVGPSYPACPKG